MNAMKRARPTLKPGILAGLGITMIEERIYVDLLTRDGATQADLISALALASKTVVRALESLEEKGLITHSPALVRRYFAVPPDIGVEALIERRQSELHHTRSAIPQLRDVTQAASVARRGNEHLVEVLSSDAAVTAVAHMIKSAKHEILCLERLPLLISPARAVDDAHAHSLGRGVIARSVTDSHLLRVPGIAERMRNQTAAGERKRIFSHLPFKLIVVDRRVGVVPLYLDNPSAPCLIVWSPSLLLALCELFEMFWRIATPFDFDASGNLKISSAAHGNDSGQLLALLASGLNDKTIEHELDISQRTFTRRMTALMRDLGASTRFHAGWLAAQSQRVDTFPQ
jgi:sugar-specific transcriptional regulator TrmB